MQDRVAAKLLLIDGDRVLLVKFQNARGESRWSAPGGGVEPGETIEEALTREVSEELGLSGVAGRIAFRRTAVFENRHGRMVRQLEHYFVARRGSYAVPSTCSDRLRAEGAVALRWWTIDDLFDTEERVFPDDLARMLRSIDPTL